MNTAIDLKKIPFARHGARLILMMKDEVLYLGLKATGAPPMLPPMFGPNGTVAVLKIAALKDGKELPYEITAGAAMTELKTAEGSVRFAVDNTCNAMRIVGDVPQLRIFSGRLLDHATSERLSDGAEIYTGVRMVFKVLKGDFCFDDTWLLNKFSCAPPCLDVFGGEDGFEIACFELPLEEAVPEPDTSFEECVRSSEAEFEALKKLLIPVDDETAYRIWTQPPTCDSCRLARESYLYQDPQAVFTHVLLSAEAGRKGVVPLYASAFLRLAREDTLDGIDPAKLRELAGAMKEALAWWDRYRFDPAKGQYFYAYRAETGEENPAWFGESPVYSLELEERISQLKAAISVLDGREVTNK